MVDLHTHAKFSPDSNAEPSDMIERAISLGMTHYGITEHRDVPYPAAATEVYHDADPSDMYAFFAYVLPLKQQYAERIKFLVGMEFGFNQQSDMSEYVKLSADLPADYIINSVHAVNGFALYWRENLIQMPRETAYRTYLQAVLDSLDAPYDYQIVGHIGYVSRNAPYADPIIHAHDFPDLTDAILQGIISRGKTLEVNTSAGNAGSLYLANRELVKRYLELGGEHISFASDAHAPGKIGAFYRETRDDLAALGVKYFDVYEDRVRKKVKA